MQPRRQLVDRVSSALLLLTAVSWVVAETPTASWGWTVALVAVVGVLAVTVLPSLVPASAPAVLSRVRRRGHDEPERQSAPGRPGRPRPRAPGRALAP